MINMIIALIVTMMGLSTTTFNGMDGESIERTQIVTASEYENIVYGWINDDITVGIRSEMNNVDEETREILRENGIRLSEIEYDYDNRVTFIIIGDGSWDICGFEYIYEY